MSQMQLPYTYKSPLFVKISSLPLLLLTIFLLANPRELAAMWTHGGALFRSILLLVVTGIFAALGEVFVRKTVLTAEGIEHRTRLGTRYFKHYSQVVSFTQTTTVRVVFDDGRRIKFSGGETWKVVAVLVRNVPHAWPSRSA